MITKTRKLVISLAAISFALSGCSLHSLSAALLNKEISQQENLTDQNEENQITLDSQEDHLNEAESKDAEKNDLEELETDLNPDLAPGQFIDFDNKTWFVNYSTLTDTAWSFNMDLTNEMNDDQFFSHSLSAQTHPPFGLSFEADQEVSWTITYDHGYGKYEIKDNQIFATDYRGDGNEQTIAYTMTPQIINGEHYLLCDMVMDSKWFEGDHMEWTMYYRYANVI